MSRLTYHCRSPRRRPVLLMARQRRPRIEELEPRTLLSASWFVPEAVPFATQFTPTATDSAIRGLTPAQVRHAYGFDRLSFDNGTVAADGRGQTIAIVDAYDDPNINDDLRVFDQTFGL